MAYGSKKRMSKAPSKAQQAQSRKQRMLNEALGAARSARGKTTKKKR